ncbi:hypothetical protein HCZ97_08655 [Pseudooceanicola sp. HF7]|nr:hypothetical protein [Pseudooceanicola sp. HF7]
MTEWAVMLMSEVVTADVVKREPKRSDFRTDDCVLIRGHHPGRRNTSDCQKQNGKQCDYDMTRARAHDCPIQAHRTSRYRFQVLMAWDATNNLVFHS